MSEYKIKNFPNKNTIFYQLFYFRGWECQHVIRRSQDPRKSYFIQVTQSFKPKTEDSDLYTKSGKTIKEIANSIDTNLLSLRMRGHVEQIIGIKTDTDFILLEHARINHLNPKFN